MTPLMVRVLATTDIGTKVIQMTGVRSPRGASIMLKCGVPFVATGIEVTSFKGSVSCRGAGVAVNEADHDFGPLCVFSASASAPSGLSSMNANAVALGGR